VAGAPKLPPSDAEETDSEFFDDGEHDGWGPIVKRRTPPPPDSNA
jgi:hypothetical protein